MAPKKAAKKAEEAKKAEDAKKAEEAKAEAPAEKKEEAKAEAPKAEAKTEAKTEAKPEAKPEAKAEAPKAEAKTEAKTEEKTEAKTETKTEPKKEEKAPEPEKPKEPEGPKELEQDAAEDKRAKIDAQAAAFNISTSTLNVLPMRELSMLGCLTEGGMQYLLAGANATVGMKSGRYMFEVKLIEKLNPAEPAGKAAVQPKNVVRVGVTASKGQLFLDGEDSISFDTEGVGAVGKQKSKLGQRFEKDVLAVLVNLDDKSPNANTVSLFKNGVRVGEPFKIPDSMKGRTLFPTLTYRGVTVAYNFGPTPWAPLPFKCAMLGSAATADVEVEKIAAPTDGKYDVAFPVGLPETGYFDFVDSFLEKHPDYVELSNRAIIAWAAKSGISKPLNKASNDKPTMHFGIAMMDDNSISKLLAAFAPKVKRNFLVAELKENLLADGRKRLCNSFNAPHFKKSALVVVGEPKEEYLSFIQQKMLTEKKTRADADKKVKDKQAERKRMLAEKVKKAEEAKRARLAKEGKTAPEPVEAKEEEPVEMDVDAPVELTADEKALKVIKRDLPDVTDVAFNKSYANFSVPSKEEGFDSITYVWDKEEACASAIKKFVLSRKLAAPAENLQPGEKFKELATGWTKAVLEWKKKQQEWKNPVQKKALLAKKLESLKKEGEEGTPELPKIDMEELEPMTVEDVCDVGNGEPLFSSFGYEDWVAMSTRFELHTMVRSFKQDLDDPDRPGFGEAHLSAYYMKYFKKTFSLPFYGVKSFADFIKYVVKDTIKVDPSTGFIATVLPEDADFAHFLKLAEAHRRERERRRDAGDETATLNFQKQPQAVPAPQGLKRPAPTAVSPAIKVMRR